ncbi:MAG: VOC family protein [Ilumatobacter sp.]|uniref:VOC family protein n=1 Tax=Ilumatobacter sp. TaxID=1967498 RepID=UPI0032971FE3
MTSPAIHPRLVVDDAAAAIDFYVTALGATELMRFAEPSGKVVQAEIQIGNDVIALTEHDGHCNLSPNHLGGSPLLLTVTVDDADATGHAMVNAGADVIIPIDDRYYGRREGRLRDTAGHLWIVSQHLEDLTDDEITERLNAN